MKIFTIFILFVFGAAGKILVENYERELSTIKLLLYPNIYSLDNPWEIANLDDQRWREVNFDSKDLKIIISGWRSTANFIATNPVLHAYLKSNNSHVLEVDWNEPAKLPYGIARQLIIYVANEICKKMEYFVSVKQIDVRNVHIIGHSLGCHVAAHVGRCFNGQIGRLTALDPAGVFFTKFSTDAYNKNDFLFVDSIHTSAGLLGEYVFRSHAAFYPNRGLAPQPGCEGSDLFSFTACSHYIASQFYAESILFPTAFQAHQCDTSVIKSPTAHYNCINESNVVWMGEYIDRNARGTFYLETFETFPYGMNAL